MIVNIARTARIRMTPPFVIALGQRCSRERRLYITDHYIIYLSPGKHAGDLRDELPVFFRSLAAAAV